MRDSLGGTVVITIIVVFIVVALGYMAFNVNYTKAFRMKNKIISLYEEYGAGDSGSKCEEDSTCLDKIVEYAKELGYTGGELNCKDGASSVRDLYCVKDYSTETMDGTNKRTSVYYKIVTKININIPIINNIFDMRAFEISGNTRSFTYYVGE